MNVASRVYYELSTGNVILRTSERSGYVVDTTVEQDFESYTELASRVPSTVGMLQLTYGQYQDDFNRTPDYRVNLATGALEFSYPDPTAPDAPPVYVKPITDQLADQIKTLQDAVNTLLGL